MKSNWLVISLFSIIASVSAGHHFLAPYSYPYSYRNVYPLPVRTVEAPVVLPHPAFRAAPFIRPAPVHIGPDPLLRTVPPVPIPAPAPAPLFASPLTAAHFAQAVPVPYPPAPALAPAPVAAPAPVFPPPTPVAPAIPAFAAAPAHVAPPPPPPSIVAPVAKLDYADAYPQYHYAYDVQDALTGDNKAQEEIRDGGVVRGRYSLIEADGSRRTVNYYADPLNGFNALVQKDVPVPVAPVPPPPPPPGATF